jgi:hypothetical protein
MEPRSKTLAGGKSHTCSEPSDCARRTGAPFLRYFPDRQGETSYRWRRDRGRLARALSHVR